MATLPGRSCRHIGCIEITKDRSGYCDKHKNQYKRQYGKQTDARRGTARERGYDNKWEKFRDWFLSLPGNQICHRCLELCGDVRPSEVVHHIQPVADRPDLRLVEDNCQPLCRSCHEEIHGRG